MICKATQHTKVYYNQDDALEILDCRILCKTFSQAFLFLNRRVYSSCRSFSCAVQESMDAFFSTLASFLHGMNCNIDGFLSRDLFYKLDIYLFVSYKHDNIRLFTCNKNVTRETLTNNQPKGQKE
jgi:hypothetical protein